MSTSRMPASVLSRPTSKRPLARSTSRQTIAPVAEARPAAEHQRGDRRAPAGRLGRPGVGSRCGRGCRTPITASPRSSWPAASSHDGSMAVTTAVTPIRIVCANTLGAALRQAEHEVNAQRTFRFRHTGNLQTKFAEAQRVLWLAIDLPRPFRALADRLGAKQISDTAPEHRCCAPVHDREGHRREGARQSARDRLGASDASRPRPRRGRPATFPGRSRRRSTLSPSS